MKVQYIAALVGALLTLVSGASNTAQGSPHCCMLDTWRGVEKGVRYVESTGGTKELEDFTTHYHVDMANQRFFLNMTTRDLHIGMLMLMDTNMKYTILYDFNTCFEEEDNETIWDNCHYGTLRRSVSLAWTLDIDILKVADTEVGTRTEMEITSRTCFPVKTLTTKNGSPVAESWLYDFTGQLTDEVFVPPTGCWKKQHLDPQSEAAYKKVLDIAHPFWT